MLILFWLFPSRYCFYHLNFANESLHQRPQASQSQSSCKTVLTTAYVLLQSMFPLSSFQLMFCSSTSASLVPLKINLPNLNVSLQVCSQTSIFSLVRKRIHVNRSPMQSFLYYLDKPNEFTISEQRTGYLLLLWLCLQVSCLMVKT